MGPRKNAIQSAEHGSIVAGVEKVDGYHAVIVGAGAAGLSAATCAASLAARVLVLDCDNGASSDFAKSGGGSAAAGTSFQEAAGIVDSPELWVEDIKRKTNNSVEESIVRLVTSRARDAIHFQARRLAMDLHLVGNIPVAGHSVSRLYGTPAEAGREYFETLAAAADRMPNIVRINDAEVTDLVTAGGAVTGVRARIRGREQQFSAPFTLLACGGFAANRILLRRFMPEIADALHIGCPRNDGRGMTWGQSLGAATSFLDSYQGHGHVTVDGKGRLGLGLTTLGAILIDRNGRRFVREDMRAFGVGRTRACGRGQHSHRGLRSTHPRRGLDHGRVSRRRRARCCGDRADSG